MRMVRHTREPGIMEETMIEDSVSCTRLTGINESDLGEATMVKDVGRPGSPT